MPILNIGCRADQGPRFQVLCEEHLEEIHHATLEVMERTGCLSPAR